MALLRRSPRHAARRGEEPSLGPRRLPGGEEGIVGDQHEHRDVGARLTRREALTAGLVLAAGGTLAAMPARPAAAAA
jgi:hypothetical protein